MHSRAFVFGFNALYDLLAWATQKLEALKDYTSKKYSYMPEQEMNSYDIGTHLALWDEILHYVLTQLTLWNMYTKVAVGVVVCGSGEVDRKFSPSLSLSRIVTEWVRKETEGECIIE